MITLLFGPTRTVLVMNKIIVSYSTDWVAPVPYIGNAISDDHIKELELFIEDINKCLFEVQDRGHNINVFDKTAQNEYSILSNCVYQLKVMKNQAERAIRPEDENANTSSIQVYTTTMAHERR